jgi:1-aminocyclopropane-1-carboxylate synthase
VAENKLAIDMFSERFTQAGMAAFSEPSVYCYDSFVGSTVARKAVAYFLARRFLYPDDENLSPVVALESIQPKHVALAAGAAPLLNHLCFLLGEAGDACLIPAPYYAAFENDIKVVAGVEPCRIQQSNPVVGPSNEELERAHREARSVRMAFEK